MIKLLLCLVLFGCGAYGWRERRMSPLVGFATPVLAVAGMFLVLNPHVSSKLAEMLGVGRGADLIFYLWTVLSALLIANVHFRLRYQKETLTSLARELALLSANLPKPTGQTDTEEVLERKSPSVRITRG